MKKIHLFLMAVVLILSLTACSGSEEAVQSSSISSASAEVSESETETPSKEAAQAETEEETEEETEAEIGEDSAVLLQCGDEIDNENFTMTFDSVELLPEYSYKKTEYSTTHLYVEDGYQLVVLKGHFENKSTSVISSNIFSLTACVNDNYIVDGHDVRFNFIRNKNFEIDPYTDLDYVMYINIPNKLADMFNVAVFTIGFNNDMSLPKTIISMDGTKTTPTDNLYTLTSGTETNAAPDDTSNEATEEDAVAKEEVKTIAIGEMITTDDYELTLTNVGLSYEVLPTDTSGVHRTYPADSGKVYIDVVATVKNTMQRDIRINELFTASALYDGQYPYTGFTIVDTGNSFDWASSYVAATPLETIKVHALIECPVEVDTSGKSIVVMLEIGSNTYEYIIR